MDQVVIDVAFPRHAGGDEWAGALIEGQEGGFVAVFDEEPRKRNQGINCIMLT